MGQGTIVTNSTMEIRSLARTALKNAWSRLFIAWFIAQSISSFIPGFIARIIPGMFRTYEFSYMGITQTVQYSFIPFITYMVFNGPFRFALSGMNLKQLRTRKVEVQDIFNGFKHFPRTFLTQISIWISIFVPVLPFLLLVAILPIVFGRGSAFLQGIGSALGMIALASGMVVLILMVLLVSMSFYLLSDNPKMNPIETIKASITLMKKNATRFLMLRLSYLGWGIIASMLSYALTGMLSTALSGNWVIEYLINIIGNLPLIIYSIYLDMGEAFFYEFATGHLMKTGPSVRSQAFQ